MFLDSSVIYSRLQDPEKSTVVGKIKAAPYPQGPAGRIGHAHFWSISISEKSAKKRQAWMFVEWATSKMMMYRVGLKGVVAPRASVWAEPEFSSQFTPDFSLALQETLKTAVISHAHSRFFEMMDILTGEMQKAILGEEDVEKALDFTQSRWEQIIADWKASKE
jgi:multiple sugar transport system substrate-binding protein